MKTDNLFAEQFDFRPPATVDFVGGGGKTSLILRLLDEHSQSATTLYTTTTRMHPPDPVHGMVIISGGSDVPLLQILDRIARKGDGRLRKLVVTGPESRPGLLSGMPPDFAARLDRELFPLVLNEADGARRMSLKMPRDGEPVLMDGANYLVPVIGVDCLGKALGPDSLFRWELASKRHALPAGACITPRLAASLLLHPEGVCKGWRPGMRIIPYINKVENNAQLALAQALAQELLHHEHFPVQSVVWGSVQLSRVGRFSAQVQ